MLRQEWGFRRVHHSDGDGLQMLVEPHHVAYQHRGRARGRPWLPELTTMSLAGGLVFHTLTDQVKRGRCRRAKWIVPWRGCWRRSSDWDCLTIRYVDPDYAEKINNGEEHRKLAVEAARKVIVLLKNDKNLLPLDLTKLKTIAVIGPNAADVHLGGYSRDPGTA